MLSCGLSEIRKYEFTDLDGKTHTFEVEELIQGGAFRGYELRVPPRLAGSAPRCNYESQIIPMIQTYILHADIPAMPPVRRVTPRKTL